MAKIICITSGLTGILNASFELVARLQSAGHEVVYASPRMVKKRVDQEGISFIALPEIKQDVSPDIPVFQGPLRKLKRLYHKLKYAKERRLATHKNITPNEFVSMLAKESPDLLIIDVELHEYIFMAYAKKQPFIILSQWFSLWKRKGLPYLLTDTVPKNGWRGNQLMMDLAWRKVEINRWWTFTKKRFLSAGTDRRSALKALAKRVNFPVEAIKDNYWPGPFTYSHVPVLSMTALEMEFPHDPPPHLQYVGPMVFEGRKEVIPDEKEQALFHAALTYRKKMGGELIYCSLSTLSKGDVQFIKKLITAVELMKEWALIISMGGKLRKGGFDEVPSNVFLFSYVPQLKVLSAADLSINHGGIHTINECVHFKVPMLVYSGKRSDQNGCAARVAYHQLGLMADKDKDDSMAIRQKINEVLTNNVYRQNVAAMHYQCAKYREEASLEKVIEKSLKASTKID